MGVKTKMRKLYFKDVIYFVINICFFIVILYALKPIIEFFMYQNMLLFPELYSWGDN